MHKYGKIGGKVEGHYLTLRDAIDAAIGHSIDEDVNPIGIWDKRDRLILVVVEGDVFERQIK